MKRNVIIIGAAGRDFHNFNTFFRGNKDYNVVAFTANQIPDIDGRKYPTELAGKEYPAGIPHRSRRGVARTHQKTQSRRVCLRIFRRTLQSRNERKCNSKRCRSRLLAARY